MPVIVDPRRSGPKVYIKLHLASTFKLALHFAKSTQWMMIVHNFSYHHYTYARCMDVNLMHFAFFLIFEKNDMTMPFIYIISFGVLHYLLHNGL